MHQRKKNTIEFMTLVAIMTLLASAISFISIFGESLLRREGSPIAERGLGGTLMDGFTVTAYCPGSCCNGVWHGKTAGGIDLSVYLTLGIAVIAVDPSIIPLGSLVQYGERIYLSADTGGMIKGKRIDVLLPEHESTVNFGVRNNQTIMVLNASDPGE